MHIEGLGQRACKNVMGAGRAAVQTNCQHPLGVQPWGNYLFAQSKDTRNEGTCECNLVYIEVPRQNVMHLPQFSLILDSLHDQRHIQCRIGLCVSLLLYPVALQDSGD